MRFAHPRCCFNDRRNLESFSHSGRHLAHGILRVTRRREPRSFQVLNRELPQRVRDSLYGSIFSRADGSNLLAAALIIKGCRVAPQTLKHGAATSVSNPYSKLSSRVSRCCDTTLSHLQCGFGRSCKLPFEGLHPCDLALGVVSFIMQELIAYSSPAECPHLARSDRPFTPYIPNSSCDKLPSTELSNFTARRKMSSNTLLLANGL